MDGYLKHKVETWKAKHCCYCLLFCLVINHPVRRPVFHRIGGHCKVDNNLCDDTPPSLAVRGEVTGQCSAVVNCTVHTPP